MDKWKRMTAWLAMAALVVFAILMVLSAAQFYAVSEAGETSAWARLLPIPFYLYAVGAIWWSLRRIAHGQGLAPAVARLLRRVGLSLLAGGVVEVLGLNLYSYLVTSRSLTDFDITAITISVVGFGLYSVAGLIERGIEMRDELDSFI
ncbi:DUF2975 domain-containing protein [Sphingomicrobium aestuariivivum]|uniref:DUF2975 domain-containing protein n=1 Tax=Sphingomicrobium aestuariivivum TaxID=1582356 RepID=UPI001FD65E12|nr:DUF2975 domain-containing protein [Sphingomicrobium aestuariivivum]MCJ8189930.1 DUF2975 domain-containing protein [Sphingomicrobium aestuariivivum]